MHKEVQGELQQVNARRHGDYRHTPFLQLQYTHKAQGEFRVIWSAVCLEEHI